MGGGWSRVAGSRGAGAQLCGACGSREASDGGDDGGGDGAVKDAAQWYRRGAVKDAAQWCR